MESTFSLSPTERRVLDAIWRQGPISRVQIAELVGLTKPSISLVMRSLADAGLVVEQAPLRGMRGQPARPLTIRGEAGFAAGVNFSHSYLEVGLIDLAGRLLGLRHAPLGAPSPETIATTAHDSLKALADELGLDLDRAIGVGFSVPGDFYADGCSLAAHAWFPDLKERDLQAAFSPSFSAPVFIENDGRSAAVGERVLGHGRRYRSFMLAHIGHGLGGGLILNGRPYSGAHGNAGTLGHFHPYGSPRPSGQDLLEFLWAQGFDHRDFDALETLDVEAEPVAAWLDRAARQFSQSLPMVARFLGPEAVILAGRLPPAYTDALVRRIDLKGLMAGMDDLPTPVLAPSSLGSSAGVVGAACVPILKQLLP